MKKDLKTYIRENKAAFDDATPPLDLWQRIAGGLDEQPRLHVEKRGGRTVWVARILKVAAIALLIGTMGILLYFYGRNDTYVEYSRINPDLAAEQQVYAQLVMQKKDSIEYIAVSDPKLYAEFSKVLDQIEANYDMLKQEFSQSPNKELTLEAMIRNLQAQIEILSQQLEILNYINDSKSQNRNEQI